MASTDKKNPFYKVLREWLKVYARPEVQDKRAIHEFMDLESAEKIRSMRAELISLSKGRYELRIAKEFLGNKRLVKHGSPEDWSKLMLMWMANEKK